MLCYVIEMVDLVREYNELVERYSGRYHIRITKDIDPFVFLDNYSCYVIGSEDGHCHIALFTNESRGDVKACLKSCYDLKGNKDYSLTEIRRVREMLSYICKEGRIKFSGINPTLLFVSKKMAVQKDGMQVAINDLDESFYKNKDMSGRQWLVCRIKIQLKFCKSVCGKQLHSQMVHRVLNRDSSKIVDYVDDLCKWDNF